MLGTIENARIIQDVWDKDEVLPPGWVFVNEGSARQVFLGPDGVIYKVGGVPELDLNEVEWMRRLRNNPELKRLEVTTPKAGLYPVGHRDGESRYVVTMDYIKPAHTIKCRKWKYDFKPKAKCTCRTFGQPRICYGLLLHRLDEFGINDIWEENVIHASNNLFYLIDLEVQGI